MEKNTLDILKSATTTVEGTYHEKVWQKDKRDKKLAEIIKSDIDREKEVDLKNCTRDQEKFPDLNLILIKSQKSSLSVTLLKNPFKITPTDRYHGNS